jgi:hypothetical protein
METPQNTSQSLYRILRIIYIAILTGTILYIAFAYVFIKQSDEKVIYTNAEMQYFWFASLLFTLLMIPGSYYFYKMKTECIDKNLTLIQKLVAYRVPFLLRLALLETCCIVNAILYLMTRYEYIYFTAAFALIIMLLNFPRRSSLANDLKLTFEESEQL